MRNKRLRSILLACLGLGIGIAFFWYLYTHADEYLGLLRVSAGGLILLFILWLAVPC